MGGSSLSQRKSIVRTSLTRDIVSLLHGHASPAREDHMAIHIGRREVLCTLASAAVTWPLAARAQQGERLRRVDVLFAELTEDDPYYEGRLTALTEALRGLGWIESKNLKLVIHRITPRPADIRKQVTELLAERPDVVVSGGS